VGRGDLLVNLKAHGVDFKAMAVSKREDMESHDTLHHRYTSTAGAVDRIMLVATRADGLAVVMPWWAVAESSHARRLPRVASELGDQGPQGFGQGCHRLVFVVQRCGHAPQPDGDPSIPLVPYAAWRGWCCPTIEGGRVRESVGEGVYVRGRESGREREAPVRQ
jgi:hypothetical protein